MHDFHATFETREQLNEFVYQAKSYFHAIGESPEKFIVQGESDTDAEDIDDSHFRYGITRKVTKKSIKIVRYVVEKSKELTPDKPVSSVSEALVIAGLLRLNLDESGNVYMGTPTTSSYMDLKLFLMTEYSCTHPDGALRYIDWLLENDFVALALKNPATNETLFWSSKDSRHDDDFVLVLSGNLRKAFEKKQS